MAGEAEEPLFGKLQEESGSIFDRLRPSAAPEPPEAPEPPAPAALNVRLEELRQGLSAAQAKTIEVLSKLAEREEAERQAQSVFEAARVQARLEEAKRIEKDVVASLQARIRELETKLLDAGRVDALSHRLSQLEAALPELSKLAGRVEDLERADRYVSREIGELRDAVQDLKADRDAARLALTEAARLSEGLARLTEAVRLRSELAELQSAALIERLRVVESKPPSQPASGLAASNPKRSKDSTTL